MLEMVILERFFAALALGALIGLEREYTRFRKGIQEFAGIRTFPLISLFGALCAYLAEVFTLWVLVVGTILIGLLIAIAYFALSEHSPRQVGSTSEIAGFITFFIGVLCYSGEFTLALIITVVTTLILYSRSFLHSFAKKISKNEMADTLKFAVIAFVILPLLPNQNYGPYGIFNPYLTWLMVVLVSGIGFAGYVAMKWFGDKGIAISAILGGLISSLAVDSNLAHRSKRDLNLFHVLTLGVVLANLVMLVRIMTIIFITNNLLFWDLLLPFGILELLSLFFGYFLWKKAKNVSGDFELKSPFTLLPALKFAALFALIIALTKLVNIYFSSTGVYAISFLSGFADLNAITLSLSHLAKTTISMDTAVTGIMLAVLTNMGVKGGIAYFMGSREFSRSVLVFYGVLILVGIALMMIL